MKAHDDAANRYLKAERDPHTPGLALERLATATRTTRERALHAINPSLIAGLEQREGRRLRPLIATHPDLSEDSLVWASVKAYLAELGVRPSGSLLVCSGCTLVFRPKRKDELACDLCRKRLPNPSVLGGPQGSPGTDPWGVRLAELLAGAAPIVEPSPWKHGERVTVAAPKLRNGVVVGWGEITLGLCRECGEAFGGRRDKTTCSAACRKKRNRRAA